MKNVISVFLVSFLISICSLNGFSKDKETRPTLIIFHAEWCDHCKKAKNDIEKDKQLSETIKNYYVVSADYDIDKDLVEGYNITKLPTFVIINDGKVTKKVGYKNADDLNTFLTKKGE